MTAYVTLNQVKLELGDSLNGSADYDTVLTQLVDWASSYIDQLFGHEPGAFAVGTPPPAASARRFHGSGRDQLVVAECLSVASVELYIGGAWQTLSAASYVTLPLDGVPITAIQLMPDAVTPIFTQSVANVRVTAVWGVSQDAPGTIKQAALTQTVRWFKRAQSAFGDVSAAPELGQLQYLQELDPDIKAMLMNSGLKRIAL